MASAVAILFSIAAAQILLGAAIVALVYARQPLRSPDLKWPVGLYVVGSILAALAAPDPAAALPQLKKILLLIIVPVLYTALRGVRDAVQTVWLLVGASVLSSLWSFVQFGRKYLEASRTGVDFYLLYVAKRTTGFMSHWMTFGGEIVITGLLLTAILFFALPREKRLRDAAIGGAAILGVALLLNWTRSIQIAAVVALVFLILQRRRRWLVLLPVVFGVAMMFAPMRERIFSIVRPRGTVDSNQHRIITWRTGLEMVKAHPWLGLGPGQVAKQFERYIPADVPRPLPDGYYQHLHHIFLQYAAERGVPVLLFVLWLLGRVAWDFWQAARRAEGEARALLQGALAAWIATLIGGMFENNLENSEVLHLFLATIAIGYVGVREVSAVQRRELIDRRA
ncbi:MAG: O-antigen ligase family protein [Bryobacteraceae bacterium]|nr:O-antigen ligase family protein [Bryobacteraceae bacterium]